MTEKQYVCIDLKSFYASVECVERGLDPMKTNLVVADPERTDKTICLAVTPAMKSAGVKNRCRVFEIPGNIKYIMAPPRMQKYIDYAADIYAIYLKYIAKEDIHVYSIDEVFMDVTEYLPFYKLTAKELALKLMREIYDHLGIRATAGVGTNMYLTKIALDILAKHSDDFIGVLDEKTYREKLWDHRPLTDFWRIGHGTAKSLEAIGIYTMRDITNVREEMLYKRFGIDAELLIDHAWGREPTTIEDIKNYRPKTNCLTSGQVLSRDYSFTEGELIVKEMTDNICLEMVEKNLITESVTLHIGYSNKFSLPAAHGTACIEPKTNADCLIIPAVVSLYRRIVDPQYTVKRINICCNKVTEDDGIKQLMFFGDTDKLEKNRSLQKAVIGIKHKYGKNAVLKGMNFEQAATMRERNHQIGGHRSGE